MNASVWISLVAVGVSLFALGWNIYRDVIIKPRLKVSLGFASIARTESGNPLLITTSRRIPANNPFIVVQGVNHGPGKIRCTAIMAIAKDRERRKRLGVIAHDSNHEASQTLPKVLEVGDQVTLSVPLLADCFFNDARRVGIKDSFGRVHWARRGTVRRMRKAIR